MPFKVFLGAESIFVKLVTLKIAPGSGLIELPHAPGLFSDTTGTNLSKFTVLDPLPIYTQKTFAIKQTVSTYEIQYKGSDLKQRPKLFFVMLLNSDYNLSNFIANGIINEDLVAFKCSSAAASGSVPKKILCFAEESVTISKAPCQIILLLEFEIHNNYKGNKPNQPTFFPDNPLFGIEGIRLINVAEFDA